MPLVNIKDMLQHAYDNQYAVGAFDLINLDFLQGILQAAEEMQAPVILSLAESHFEHFDFDLLMPAVESAARRASIPVAIHFDHGHSFDSAVKAIRLGCNSIMVDASESSLNDNIEITKKIVSMSHGCGIAVEGELGYVPGVEGEDAKHHPGEICYTTVEDAKTYLENTHIDFLAVSIGTVHGRLQGKANLDFQRLKEINQELGIPLVIHGGTGLDDEQFKQLIQNGVAKINYYTALADVAAQQIKHNSSSSEKISYTDNMKGVTAAIANEVMRCIKLWGSAKKAGEVLAHCQPWKSVEHLIIYNVEGINSTSAKEMITEGYTILSSIPGVRSIFVGETIKKEAQYQYTWLVRFCHPSVIDTYREHPEHVAFADNLFRPVAGNRISIDYLELPV